MSENAVTCLETIGMLSVADFARCFGLSNAETTGTTLGEAQDIMKPLTLLGDVTRAL